MNGRLLLGSVAPLCLLTLCAGAAPAAKPGVQKLNFGKTADGTAVDLYVLTGARGLVADITTYGAIVTELWAPDKAGKLDDVVLGFDNLAAYLKGDPYFGATVGRYANRIAKGKFTLGGKQYTLATNNGPNALHGGLKGFDKVVWTARVISSGATPAVEFSYTSKDGEEGYPGTLKARVRFTVTPANELKIQYWATTDKPTVVNLTNHSNFNLGGAQNGGILGHRMMIDADCYTPVDDTLIPTGVIAKVDGTPMDFRKPERIGARIAKVGGDPVGYDHNYVLNKQGPVLSLAARVSEAKSGRVLEMFTTEPGVQFYSGNFLDGTLKGKDGVVYKQYHGFCLEAQHYPDSPNHKSFPSVVLRPRQLYTQTTIYKFSARAK